MTEKTIIKRIYTDKKYYNREIGWIEFFKNQNSAATPYIFSYLMNSKGYDVVHMSNPAYVSVSSFNNYKKFFKDNKDFLMLDVPDYYCNGTKIIFIKKKLLKNTKIYLKADYYVNYIHNKDIPLALSFNKNDNPYLPLNSINLEKILSCVNREKVILDPAVFDIYSLIKRQMYNIKEMIEKHNKDLIELENSFKLLDPAFERLKEKVGEEIYSQAALVHEIS